MSIELNNEIDTKKPINNIEKNEKRERIMETAKVERLKLLGNISERIIEYVKKIKPESFKNLMLNILDFTPVSSLKMGIETVKGEKFTGESLSAMDRIMYTLIVTTNLAFYGLTAYGLSKGGDAQSLKLGGEFHLASFLFLSAQKGPQIMEAAKNLAEKYKMQQLKEFFEAFQKIVEKYGYEKLTKLINIAKNETA